MHQAERDEWQRQASEARAAEADATHERQLIKRALHRVVSGLPPAHSAAAQRSSGDESDQDDNTAEGNGSARQHGRSFEARTLSALLQSPLAASVSAAASHRRQIERQAASSTSNAARTSASEAFSITALLLEVAAKEEAVERAHADARHLVDENAALRAQLADAQHAFNEQVGAADTANANAARARRAETAALDALALERDRAAAATAECEAAVDRLAALEACAQQYAHEAEHNRRALEQRASAADEALRDARHEAAAARQLCGELESVAAQARGWNGGVDHCCMK